MTMPPPPPADMPAAAFDAARARVSGFARRHFSVRGTLRLHRAALGWDLLRAPANTALAPVNLLLRLLAMALYAARARGLARRIAARPLILRTDTARAIERLVRDELLGPPIAADALHLGAYGDTRGAVAEFTTSLVPLGAGAALFKTVTPGVLSLAPAFALSVAQGAAIAAFPLGGGIGALWYGAFPAAPSTGLTLGVAAAMMLVLSLCASFAGLVADPVQLRLGIHQRRLHRLIDALEAEARDAGSGRFAAGEHYLARVWDATDAGVSLIRMLGR
ncbi:DUF6635 family protein [Frigidibacter sp. MR17.24]|uniref:DUF6635 family protein n=1 Tax=Frigidibacter sp. MR17.24 TaxID=3127345 RepID=UPI003012E067